MSAFDELFSNDVFLTAFSAPITYGRGALAVLINAMDSVIDSDDNLDYGAAVNSEYREFVFKISDLKFNDIETYPVRGDTIIDANNTTWELQNVQGQPCAEIDADQNYYRVRCVKIESPQEVIYVVDDSGNYILTDSGDYITIESI